MQPHLSDDFNNWKVWVMVAVTQVSYCELSGLQTSQDAHFYALSSRFADFNNKDEPLVIQFTVKHEQSIDCGGGYIKLFPSDLKQEDMHGDSTYNIMFGEYFINHLFLLMSILNLMWNQTSHVHLDVQDDLTHTFIYSRSWHLWPWHQESTCNLQLQRQKSFDQQRH